MLIDPSYLRYIVDGLNSQYIQQENIATLPEGLIGIYEESIPTEQNIKQREKFLQFFSVWALLNKEVSATLVSSLLNWQEQEVINFLLGYSKWFNSPTSGTYILYHERFRAYLLSKITNDQLNKTNAIIIVACKQALESRKADEWENYALEHLPSHLLIHAMQDEEQGISFRKLVYDTSYWNRQLEISRGYDWSKKMLNLAMIWAAKQNTDELIECALNKIDLHYMEQNDAPRIVELVAQNDIETALQRIESFGGNDKEGLQRKFILYMLCLMELTLLDSKEKAFRKSAIEKLLNHLDENIRVDHSLLNWNDFFPSYLMFQMACEWAEMGLDYLRVYKRTDKWESDWIAEKGPYNDFQFHIFSESVNCLIDSKEKSKIWINVSAQYARQGMLKEAYLGVENNIINEDKNDAISIISIQLVRLGMSGEAIKYVYKCENQFWIESALKNIPIELAKKNKYNQALKIARSIKFKFWQSNVLLEIASELSKSGRSNQAITLINEAFKIAVEISDHIKKCQTLSAIFAEFYNQGKYEVSEKIMNKTVEFARSSEEMFEKVMALIEVSSQLLKIGKSKESLLILEEALQSTINILDLEEKDETIKYISIELLKHGNYEKSIELSLSIELNFIQREALRKISLELLRKKEYQIPIEIVNRIQKNESKNELLKNIYNELVNQDQIKNTYRLIQQSLVLNRKNISEKVVSSYLSKICFRLFKIGRKEQSINILKNIPEINWRSYTLKALSLEYARLGNMDESIKYANSIKDEYFKIYALIGISNEFYKQGIIKKADIYFEKSLSYTNAVSKEYIKNELKINIIKELAIQQKEDKAIELILELVDEFEKTKAVKTIAIELAKQDKKDKAEIFLRKGLTHAREINRLEDKCIALIEISTELEEYGKFEDANLLINESLNIAKKIKDQFDRNEAFYNICCQLVEQGKTEEAKKQSKFISDEYKKNFVLQEIVLHQIKNDNWDLAEKTGLEIKQIELRQDCWINIAKTGIKLLASNEIFFKYPLFKSKEAQTFYLKGWAESITVDDITDELAHLAIQALQHDSTSLEHFLQVYAQHELFFGNPSQEKIDRLNKTLNLQWALDIIAQFPEE